MLQQQVGFRGFRVTAVLFDDHGRRGGAGGVQEEDDDFETPNLLAPANVTRSL